MLHKKGVSVIRKKRFKNQFRRETILDNLRGGQLIQSLIESGEPVMVARFSTCEIDVMNICRQRSKNALSRTLRFLFDGIPMQYTDPVRFRAHNNAGIFPNNDSGLDAFAQVAFNACSRIDLLGVWGNSLHLEETLWRERCPSAQLIELPAIEPYYSPSPWSAALRGKRVLVVHPFEASIQQQFSNREKLFPKTDVLPSFELQTLKAVQSNAGADPDFDSWVDAFEFMKAKIGTMDFDVALIGAGAYGLPLAAAVKDQGRQAIHMGGALQILFGIKGGRWDDLPKVNRFYNEHWVRPLAEETPSQSGLVEEGCYW